MDKLNKKMTKYASTIVIVFAMLILGLTIIGININHKQNVIDKQDTQTGENLLNHLIDNGLTEVEDIENKYNTSVAQKSLVQNVCMNKTATNNLLEIKEYKILLPNTCEAVGYKLN